MILYIFLSVKGEKKILTKSKFYSVNMPSHEG